MAAVVRIKRRLEEEPLEALILNCKRPKLNDSTHHASSNELESSCTILTLAGTIKENENILKHLKKKNSNEIRDVYKSHPIQLTQKLRQEHNEKSKNNRYKVVNCMRSISVEANNVCKDIADAENPAITILDVESHEQNVEKRENEDKYVYDLYYTSSDYLADAELDEQQFISIYPLKDPLFFSPTEDQIENDTDSEDSNAENNWRNDYPDEDDVLSVTEDDMVEAMKNVDLEDDLLSSDDEEEGFVYSVDSEAAGFEEDIDESDVHRYGERYARFKARHKKQEEASNGLHDLYYGDIDDETNEDSYEYY